MNKRIIICLIVGVLILTIAYSFTLSKNVEYTEIEYGVMFEVPHPEEGSLLTGKYFLRNNNFQTVIVKPFNFTHCEYYGQSCSNVIGVVNLDEPIRLEPNESIILLNQTFVPWKIGIFTVDAFEEKYSISIDESWVPNNISIRYDGLCVERFIEFNEASGFLYWNVTVGPIMYSPYLIGGEYKLIRYISATTTMGNGTIFYPYAGIITEDFDVEIVRLY